MLRKLTRLKVLRLLWVLLTWWVSGEFFASQTLAAPDGSSVRIQPANKPKPSSKNSASVTVKWDPMVWMFRRHDCASNYLLGTIHLPTQATLKLPPAAAEAFQKSGAVFCEIAFDTSAQQKVAAAISKAPKPLTEALPKELADRCERALQSIHSSLHLEHFDGMEIWAFAFQLAILEEHFKNPDVLPMDPRLYQMAQQAGKTVGGLETVEEQTSAISSSLEDQVSLLKATVDELEEAARAGHSVSQPLLNAFLKGDLEDLRSLFGKTMERYPPALKALLENNVLTKRNQTVTTRIVKEVTENPSRSHLFAMGAMHFVGVDGVVALLEKEGFTVERVQNRAKDKTPKAR